MKLKPKQEYWVAGRMEFSKLKSKKELLRFRMPDTGCQLKFYPASGILYLESRSHSDKHFNRRMI
jgi:hypothetical protein